MTVDLAIATYGLTKQFDRQIAVNDVELAIRPGEVYGLIGPNGAGKTTLIRMLATIEEPSAGEIYLAGERLRPGRDNRRLKQHLGYLPDDYPLYDDLTVWDYLDYFARLYRLRSPQRQRRLHEVLDLVQLSSKRYSNIATLSRGMKQRLSLARTILHEPIVLLLDEPVSGLDPLARQQFRQIIKVLKEAGMTVLISSHVLSDLAELCTTIGIMELGCLVESAPLPELYARLARPYLVIGTLAADNAILESELRRCPQVQGWEALSEAQTWRVAFDGTEAEASALLQALVQAGVAMVQFRYERDDLEQIFLSLGHQQAS
ncbi:MAG: ABC transporter ATP-binding protein [Spirulinaceae cyanobacterium RM2_2_10]|nr:ABC transporter ATP-binding protein [Spirulinaceae cyanobacterium SM2_1_0]NJO20745.1 ABC transporter ATP-binding protein [Spirulinaceae cyanobacterium RM2_2_10]